jgi:hypothetical protein
MLSWLGGVAWRSSLLPAKCFTSTTSFGWHHLSKKPDKAHPGVTPLQRDEQISR